MLSFDINLDGDGAFRDVVEAGKEVIHLGNDAAPIRLAALADGMKSGKPSVVLGFDIGDGKFVMVETSLALFLMAADALRARFGDPR